eukprot:jgi/Ulvmu1/8205/UM041_0014.1
MLEVVYMSMPRSAGVGASLSHPASNVQGKSHISEICYMIREVSEYLTIPPWVAGHAMMYCQIYFETRTSELNDCLAIAIAAMFLACKVPELAGSAVQTQGADPLMADFDRGPLMADFDRGHLTVLVRTCLEWAALRDNQRSTTSGKQHVKLYVARQERAMKERVLAAERAILMDLGYQFVDYPLHGDVYQRCELLDASPELTQAAWNMASDSFTSSIPLRASCIELAWGVIDAAARMLGQQQCLRNAGGGHVWEEEGLEHSVVEGISVSVQGLYIACE